ncbi:hypothetical protein RRG08_037681 [Elysia crispata]|uniref:Uncharacterized protein n=1 Tax=Elysia crispata TaxID=231223 RepID=A0AAE1A7F5_9GAST|nr:hypothetical protein RRG08_037681 [Elysia crispata]
MSTKTLVSEILRRGEAIPEKPAFIFLGSNGRRSVLTFSDVSSLSQKFAAKLRTLGISNGDVVCNMLPTSPERIITQLGTIMAGAVFMNGQMCFADGSDFIKSLNNGRAMAFIHDPNDPNVAYQVLKNKAMPESTEDKFVCPDVPLLRMIIPCVLEINRRTGKCLLEELYETSETICEDIRPDSVCAYTGTSGSNTPFKLVSYTNQYLIEAGRCMGEVNGLDSNSILFNDKPFGWLVGAPVLVFAMGCTRVTVDETVPRETGYPHVVKEALRQENCTAAITVPSFLGKIVKEMAKGQDEKDYLLRSIGVLGGPITSTVLKAIGTVAESLVLMYGSSETDIAAAMTVTRKDQEYTDFLCGWPVEGTEFRIVDSNMMNVPIGHTGEILLKKPRCSSGYVNNDKANRETFLSDGWISLGDRGFLNDKGQISVLGRGANAIMHDDDVVYPHQLEAPLLQCPGLAEVLVTGVPDETHFEEICGLLVRHPDAGDEINEDYVHCFCREKLFVAAVNENLECKLIPKYLRFVDAIPKLRNGKDDRIAAKRLALQLVNDCKAK